MRISVAVLDYLYSPGQIRYILEEILDVLRAYPNNRVVMRPSEKSEAKAAGQKCSEAWFSPR